MKLLQRMFGSSATQALTNTQEDHAEGGHGAGSQDGHGHRLCAETEIVLARAGKGGYFKVYPSEGEKIVFNVWISPNPQHVDRRGNRARKLFPKVYYRDGEAVLRFKGKGPSLPMGVLYGKPVDTSRFPPEYAEDLTEFLEAFTAGIEAYDAAREERLAARKST